MTKTKAAVAADSTIDTVVDETREERIARITAEGIHNPLYRFRTPERMRRRGQSHFDTKRGDVYNGDGLCNIWPGDFTYIDDPTLEIDIAMWEDNDDDTKSIAMYLKMTGQDGYHVAMAGDFVAAERLRLAWRPDGPDGTGRLTLAGKSKKTMVLMWRTAEFAERAEKSLLRFSDDIQKSAEAKQSELQNKLGSLGAAVKVGIQDDDGSDKLSQNDLPSFNG